MDKKEASEIKVSILTNEFLLDKLIEDIEREAEHYSDFCDFDELKCLSIIITQLQQVLDSGDLDEKIQTIIEYQKRMEGEK